MRRLLPLLILSLSLAACRAPEGPAARYRRFAEAVRGGRTGEAWALISSDSRQALAARGKALAGETPPPGVDLSGRELLLGDLSPTSPKVKSVTLVREEGDRAVVAVEEEGGGRGEATLVREGGEWQVVLPEG
jgi:surface antigen